MSDYYTNLVAQEDQRQFDQYDANLHDSHVHAWASVNEDIPF